MKTIISIKRNWLFVMALLMAFTIMSCEKNDGGGNPVIHYVRVTDPALVDSTFTDVQPGQMIAIIGENFNNLKKVYINDQDIPFNVNLTTSSSIIVTVPAELPLTGTNPELKGEIRVVTDNGVCSYSMHVLSPAPAIKRLVINYPAVPGQTMKVLGSNFVEIERIYFTTENPADLEEETPTRAATEIDVKDYTVNVDFTELSFAIPQGIFDFGYLVIQCYTDKAVSEFYKDLPVPVATKISSDMPVVGSEVYITGSNFMAVTSVNVNDQYTILATDLTVSESFDTIRFVMPKVPTKSGKISVVTLGGVAEIKEPFYPLLNVILDYDSKGKYSWGNNTESVVASSSEAPFVSTGTCYAIKGKPGAWQYWWGNAVNNTELPATDVIPGTTPVEDLELRFECYVSYPLDNVIFEYVLCGDFDHKYGDFVPTDRMTGTTTLGRWFTCSTPISKFTASSVYQELLDRNNNELGLYTKNPSENANTVVEMFFDNFRIVKVK